jgi:hypothetical protein
MTRRNNINIKNLFAMPEGEKRAEEEDERR